MKSQPPDEIEAQASQWFTELAGRPDPDTSATERSTLQAAFFQWITSSPEHLKAFLEVDATFTVLGGMDPHRQIEVSRLMDRTPNNVVPIREAPGSGNSAPLSPSDWASSRSYWVPKTRRGPWSWVAILLGVSLFGGVLFVLHGPATSPTFYATGIGETRSITLPDRTTIRLNTRTRLEVDDFSGPLREVRLLAGEALFDVTHNPSHPFRVRVGKKIVQDTGTRFSIYLHDGTTTVSVAEGSVEVFSEGPHPATAATTKQPEDQPTILTANQTAEFKAYEASNPETHTVPELELKRRLSWTEGTLWFAGETLEEVAAEFNRYNAKQIVIIDPRIPHLHVGGIFAAKDPDQFVKAVISQNSVRILPKPGADPNPNLIILGATDPKY